MQTSTKVRPSGKRLLAKVDKEDLWLKEARLSNFLGGKRELVTLLWRPLFFHVVQWKGLNVDKETQKNVARLSTDSFFRLRLLGNIISWRVSYHGHVVVCLLSLYLRPWSVCVSLSANLWCRNSLGEIGPTARPSIYLEWVYSGSHTYEVHSHTRTTLLAFSLTLTRFACRWKSSDVKVVLGITCAVEFEAKASLVP